jgi:hypothetical protein
MNLLPHFKQTILPGLITVVLACFGLSPQMQAATDVSPPPDGCYPGFTTAEGCNALLHLTTGAGNTGVGWYSLFSAGAGNYNTGVGAGTLVLNTGDSNTAVGAAALLLNTSGTENVAVGTDALVHNTTGNENVANGALALFSNTTGVVNTAVGGEALSSNTTGQENTANGIQALQMNTTGGFNTAIGARSLNNNTTGGGNTALGLLAGSNVTTANGVICIGAGGANVDNTTWIENVYGKTTINSTTAPVIVSADGQLGTVVSSERFKKDIGTMEKASEAILALRPVTFHYKSDTKNTPQFGLIAEEVAKVNPGLVLPDKEGKPFTVRYDAVNAMLLNEFLKAHRRMEEQDKRIEELTAQLKQQAAQIQKVSAQLAAASPSRVADLK